MGEVTAVVDISQEKLKATCVRDKVETLPCWRETEWRLSHVGERESRSSPVSERDRVETHLCQRESRNSPCRRGTE